MSRTGGEGHDQDRDSPGIPHSVRPGVQHGPTAFVVREDTGPLRHAIEAAFGSPTSEVSSSDTGTAEPGTHGLEHHPKPATTREDQEPRAGWSGLKAAAAPRSAEAAFIRPLTHPQEMITVPDVRVPTTTGSSSGQDEPGPRPVSSSARLGPTIQSCVYGGITDGK